MGVDAMGFGDVRLGAFCGLIVVFGVFPWRFGGGHTARQRDGRSPDARSLGSFLVLTTFVVMVFGESLLRFFV